MSTNEKEQNESWEELKGTVSAEDIEKYEKSLENVGELIDKLFEKNIYNKLSLRDQVKHDLFIAYALGSLHWIYMRNIGRCPLKNGIKVELDKVKEYSDKLQAIEDYEHRPRIEKTVAKRIIRHELWQNELPNKKIRFNSSDDDDNDLT